MEIGKEKMEKQSHPRQILSSYGSAPIFPFSLFYFRLSNCAFLFFRCITISKILRYSRAVKPHAKRLGQILAGGLLQCRAQVIEANVLAAEQCNHLRQAAAHRLFATRILERDEK